MFKKECRKVARSEGWDKGRMREDRSAEKGFQGAGIWFKGEKGLLGER